MNKLPLTLAACLAATGCSPSQDVGAELAKCKIKAMELYRPSTDDLESGVSPTFRYIDACMRVLGYSATASCASDTLRSHWKRCWVKV